MYKIWILCLLQMDILIIASSFNSLQIVDNSEGLPLKTNSIIFILARVADKVSDFDYIK